MSIVGYAGLPGSGKSYGVVENVVICWLLFSNWFRIVDGLGDLNTLYRCFHRHWHSHSRHDCHILWDE